MSTIYRMTLHARHGCSARLGLCLARLDEVGRERSGCLNLRIYPVPGNPMIWQVEGQWRSVAQRDAFLSSEGLRSVLAQAFDEGLYRHLQCAVELQQQVA